MKKINNKIKIMCGQKSTKSFNNFRIFMLVET